MKISCIIIDDEPIALDLIKRYVVRTPELELSGEFSSGMEAISFLKNNNVDLIFTDIRMPELSGMEMAQILDQKQTAEKPRIIFTTAYDTYALEGYSVDALDYLLKPFSYVDFSKAVLKAENYFKLIRQIPETREEKPISISTDSAPINDPFLYIKVEYQLLKIVKDQILYIEAMKDYVKIYLEKETKPILTLTTLKNIEEKLDPYKFLRIHRSYIVSLDKITAVKKNSVQIGRMEIAVTDSYRDSYNEFVDRWK
ncbi:LytTR family DNA-binding domain-containing protein [Flavobacterium sp. B17]|uniref:LytR/AlgR family response regulator transcription factor n=1 Tax=Flavobacterium sp. B17 TaxID=95618 RepID=UPI000348F306|nr:LytTR family DNA-binding domain-containing protein [Flavobacterium sp. B17]